MTIKTDSKGFLIADGPVDTVSMAHGIEAVHSDTSAILSLLRGGAHAASIRKRQRVSTPPQAMNAAVQRATSGVITSAVRSALAQSRTRDAQGRFIPNAPSELPVITKAVNAMTRKQAADKAAQKRSEATAAAASAKAVEQARDKSGRFVGRGGSRGEGGGGDSALRNTFSRLKDLFPRRSAPDLGDYEKIDPTVEAAKEVSKIVGGPLVPIGKLTKAGASRAFGIGKEPSLPWFRKIFNVLKQSHDDQGEFALTQTRILKEIDNKTGGGRVSDSGGILGGIGGMFTGRSGGLLSSLFSGAFSLGKKGLKRLPLLGALFAGGSALASIFGGDDPNKTAEQNRQDRFTGAGSGIGALIGGGVGTLLGGPVGTMIGGVIGDKVGEMVGSWFATVDWSMVGAQISDTWNSAVGTLKDDWKAVTDKLSSITKTIGDTWDALLSGAKAFLKDKFGIDVDALAKKASDVAKPAVDAVKDAGKAAVNYAKGRAEKMAQPISSATKNAVSAGRGVLEDLIPGYRHSANFDGVKGGAALSKYGSYTNDEANQIRQLKASGANTSANLKGGMPADVQAKIVAAATKEGLDPKTMLEFASIESGGNANAISNTGAIGIFQFTGKTASGVGIKNRFDVDQNIAGGMKLAKQNAAVLSRAGLAVTPENLYMMHQLGPGAAKEIIKGAANGKNISDLSADTQKAVALNYGKGSKTAADYLSANATALQSRYDTVVGSGIHVPVVATAAATSATPPTVPVAPVPATPAAPPAQTAQIPVPLNSDKPLEVRFADDRAVGQDLQNRRLAQIATGGLSG
ncbi:transglycosylase SLT domain-containing protein [Burkholderia ubonensis]|uniref:transglycosylase SLT domain-containing protein n=1 Tax=Burkholderia ubonensis TaxID=101571 RepID=UPI000752C2F8|nr:transglycosylase SLT domain-containing protein [Burkholderia ubonensis]KVS36806.1 hypothetical protein WK37_30720 [Burkholderia ubonensis]KVS47654.1 hypothetical protein WK38_21575 [Burkholderia ubonensis]KVS70965.1 hypothetical protein WK42_26640 [Burkholderia ubonensis]KVS83198.1 hypothetical protein WK44_02795 [Burkholderia ubonensis]KVS93106.1 hypothetical protein WK43_11855 [Burkholderia ubonensis]